MHWQQPISSPLRHRLLYNKLPIMLWRKVGRMCRYTLAMSINGFLLSMSWVQAAGDKTVVMPNISYKLLHKLALQSDGPSSFLMAVLTGIIESTAIDGRARHGVLAQQNLITSIASHSYAKILFPLCHFMVAGARYHVPLYQWFRMPQPMTASSIAACFCEADSPITSSKSINEKDPMVIKVTNGNYVSSGMTLLKTFMVNLGRPKADMRSRPFQTILRAIYTAFSKNIYQRRPARKKSG
jgi:hypothetical protein